MEPPAFQGLPVPQEFRAHLDHSDPQDQVEKTETLDQLEMLEILEHVVFKENVVLMDQLETVD